MGKIKIMAKYTPNKNQYKMIGSSAETKALEYLQKQGLVLIQHNFYSRFGEIDLIMQDLDTTVFIEVKNRATGINSALESITRQKQNRLIRTAQYYLMKLGKEINCRFDAVAISKNEEIQWLKNIILC